MRPVVFLGPSLARAEAAALVDADWRPPAAQGDLYRAARDGARVIGLIDGVFGAGPAVWHKEILWALAQGVRVCGAASMGALRAAEMHPFGMVGAGRIFRRFRDTPGAPDDEVAILHAPAELGWRPLTEALADIRATLAAARRAGVLHPEDAAALDREATARHFTERTWPALLPLAPAAFAAWLPAGRVSQKAADARRLLRLLTPRGLARVAPRPAPPFEETLLWRAMVARIENPFLRLL